jgi:phage shock protein A
MTYKYCFETIQPGRNHPGRIRDRLVKNCAREHARRQREIDNRRREVVQIQSTIASLNRTVAVIETSITAALDRSHVTDPQHYAFPILARTMIARRDNLKTTIATLSEQLARMDQSTTQLVAA